MKANSTRRPLQQQETNQTGKHFFKGTKEKSESQNQPFFKAKAMEDHKYSAMEKEANLVANHVSQGLKQTPSSAQQMGQMGIQRKPAEEEKKVQKKGQEDKKEDVAIQQKSETDKKEEKPVQKMSDKEQIEQPVQQKGAEEKKEETPVQKKSEGDEKEEKPLQKKDEKPTNSSEAKFDNILNKTKGGGSVLPAKVRADLEQQFNANFQQVRIHYGIDAIELCNISKAQAFTHGNDIYFNSNKFDPDSSSGLALLAHELTHVVQQNGPKK